jgi:hypothetical protein
MKMSNKLSINYVTAKKRPMFQWFVETLISQYESGVVTDQIVFIDSFLHHEEDRKENLKNIVGGRFEYLHIPPKPSIWRGKYRKTKANFFDASSTRNTGIIVAENNHVVFVDDLSALTNGWLGYHQKAALEKTVFCGAYDKVSKIVIKNNMVASYIAKNLDGRMTHQIGDENISIGGGWVFGQNVSLPLEFLEKINGYDEFLARRGCEDCNLGVRLELAGYKGKIFYNKNCLVIEDEAMHWGPENPVDFLYPKRAWKSDIKRNQEVNAFMCSAMQKIEHNHLYSEKNFRTIDTSFDLVKERELYKKTGEFKAVGDCDYFDFDGENLKEI